MNSRVTILLLESLEQAEYAFLGIPYIKSDNNIEQSK